MSFYGIRYLHLKIFSDPNDHYKLKSNSVNFLFFDYRKVSWTPTFVILFSSNLVFYKDQKAAAQVKDLL